MATLGQRSDVGEFRRQYRWLVLFIFVVFTVLAVRLFLMQVVHGDVHEAQARRNIIDETRLATTRGVIRDGQGKVLASNRPAYNVYVVPSQIDLEKTWPRAAGYLRLDDATTREIEARVIELRKDARRAEQHALIRVDVDRDVMATLETYADELPGVRVLPAPVRSYPFGELGAHMLGYMREVDAEILAEYPQGGYRAGDRLGAVGVERRWESYLKGQRGFRRFIKKKTRGELVAELEQRYLGEGHVQEPTPGRDISLTVDIELVRSAEQAMRGHLAGAVVVVDVRTGRVLAALSKPSFDPNVVSGGSGKAAVQEAFNRYFSDPLTPTLDRTVSAAYPPGSTYKPFTALAALEANLIEPQGEVDCRGGWEYGKRYFRCTGVHRHVNLHEALVQSCNSYFYELGSRIQIDQLAEVGSRYGFGVGTGVGVNPESRGRMPTRAWYTRRYKGAFRGGFTLLAAIGQGATTVNVLQLALAYGALANGGTLYRPQVVRSIETSDGTVVQDFPPRVRRMVEVDPGQLSTVKAAMVDVVLDKKGTAHAGRIEGVDVAGKTGTAQVSQLAPRGSDQSNVEYFNRDHAWFAGFAPAQSPEIAVVVLVEHGGGGGKNAVPVAMRVVRDWQRMKVERLSRQAESKKDTN
ncbi:MAG TPA: penicillin-binding protein 2 [Polyangiaceae bacterium]|nr:penicillin-binding protein 2 [Polyangiaceae bacterium]